MRCCNFSANGCAANWLKRGVPWNPPYPPVSATGVGAEPQTSLFCIQYVHPPNSRVLTICLDVWTARLPMDIMLGTTSPSSSTTQQYAGELQADLEAAYTHVRDSIGHIVQQQKAQYDQRAPLRRVILSGFIARPPLGVGVASCTNCGQVPLKVRKLGDSVYCLHRTQNRHCRPVVHFNRLKHYPSSIRLPCESCQNTQTPEQPNGTLVGTNMELMEDDTEAVP